MSHNEFENYEIVNIQPLDSMLTSIMETAYTDGYFEGASDSISIITRDIKNYSGVWDKEKMIKYLSDAKSWLKENIKDTADAEDCINENEKDVKEDNTDA